MKYYKWFNEIIQVFKNENAKCEVIISTVGKFLTTLYSDFSDNIAIDILQDL